MTFLSRTLFIFILLLVTQIYAGSFFTASSQGIGVRRYTVNVRGLGMGGTGLASPDSVGLTNYSLSKWRLINDTRATLGFQYLRFDTEISDLDFTTATTNIGGLNLAIPIKTHKVLLGISVDPYSTVDFRYVMSVQDQGITYDETVSLNGSVSKAQIALIWSPFPSIGISIGANYYFGTITDQYRLRFNNSSYFDSLHEIEYRIKGPGIGLSLDYQANKKLMFAGFIDSEPSIDINRDINSSLSQEGTEITNSGSFPLHFGVGTSFRLHPRLILSLDYTRQNWSEGLGVKQLQSEAPDALTNSRLDDWYQLGVGLERNAIKKRNSKFYDHIDYRTGFSLSGLGYQFNNEPVIQYAAHFGIGIPFSHSNRFDLAVAAGIRGDKSKNLVEENFFNFEISVTLGELWFQKFR